MSETPVRDVSDTALWVATYRAQESERPDALFNDPYAARLAGERGFEIARSIPGSRYTAWSIVVRTCIIDELVRQAVAEGADLVVNLGAGLDSRPYRLELPPDLQWVEADYPHMIEHKEKILAGERPVCRLERVKLDLADREARRAFFAGLAVRAKKIFVLTEGVLPYLTAEHVAELAQDLRANEAFRFWVVDYFAPEVEKYIRRAPRRNFLKNAPFLFNPGPDWYGFFEKQGWKARETRYSGDEARRRGRDFPLPIWARVLTAFAPRARREKMGKLIGYVLLETR